MVFQRCSIKKEGEFTSLSLPRLEELEWFLRYLKSEKILIFKCRIEQKRLIASMFFILIGEK